MKFYIYQPATQQNLEVSEESFKKATTDYGEGVGYTIQERETVEGPARVRIPTGYQLNSEGLGVSAALPKQINTAKFSRSESPYQKAAQTYIEGLDITPPTEEEKTKIRERARSAVQAEIDAITEATKQEVLRIQQQGVESLGKTRAMGARGGLLGSPMGEAQLTKTKEYTSQQISAQEKLRDYNIQAVTAGADKRANEEIEQERTTAKTNMESYLNYLKGVQEEARADIKTLASSGVTFDRIKANTKYYEQFQKETGWDDFQMETVWNSNLPEGEKIDWQSQLIKGEGGKNKMLLWGYNQKTGKVEQKTIDVDFEIPETGKTYKTTVADDGTVLLIPETFDTTPPAGKTLEQHLKDQVITYGQFAKKKEGATTETEISALNTTISSINDLLKDENDKIMEKVVNKGVTTKLFPFAWERIPSDQKSFIAGVEQLISKNTLDTLIAAKARGATFGALSDREVAMLRSAASKIGTWAMTNDKGQVLGYSIDKNSFKTELKTLRSLAEKAIAAAGGSITSDTGKKMVKVGDQDVEVGSIIENNKGQKGRVEADGSITPLQ